ncbi:ATP-grasp domain-containing protein [Ureibacillus acetophenoni]|uniref:Carbamoyl-phosphate synthase large subunit n=1 Tax=Ureibacillus acetophenoni TaxID=614649 RepID=A0A285UCX0_9BACL|nr:ATP-grasp domain-containing protein [Ureibacillus acetophenoni]SOC38436.1 carbamoyl-phosphate synthase large subunit [Ureibacillus acetophenoni]
MRDITVLITACGVQFFPGLVSCFRNNGERNIRIIGVDMNEDFCINQIVDKFYIVPSVSDELYVDEIINICKKEKVDVVIPFMSQELPRLLERKFEFEQIGTKLSISDNSILIANNKLKLYQFMKDHHLPVPKFYPVKHVSELERVCEMLGYPDKAVCLKATEGSGSRGIRIIDPKKSRFDILFNEKPNSFYISLQEMIQILSEKEEMPEMLAMEYLPGDEYSVDLLADKGNVLYIAGRESNSITASIPQEATLREDPRAYSISCDIVKKLKLDGNVDLDFKYDENGNPILMEINPRIAATLAVFAAGGMNLPYLRVKQLLGEKLPKVNINYGIKMKRKYLEIFVDEEGNEVVF